MSDSGWISAGGSRSATRPARKKRPLRTASGERSTCPTIGASRARGRKAILRAQPAVTPPSVSAGTDQPMVWIAVDNPEYKNQPKRDAAGNWLALRSDWNFPANLQALRVYTFTNAPIVELFLNGKSLGKKRAIDYADQIITWDVPNGPGTLRAVA